MMLVVIGAIAFGVSLLTLFSGFGLGTLLMPVFALFFPVETAVAATAVVHGANSFFKVGILGREIDRSVLVRFGIPAVLAALIGAWLLTRLSGQAPLLRWQLGDRIAEVTPVGLVMGLLILGFAAFELVPALRELRAPTRYLPVGGALSGFFGGLSGHQGALRAAFLTPLGLTPTAFAATQAALAALVDLSRLVVYAAGFFAGSLPGPGGGQWTAVVVGSLAAFAGALVGKRLLGKTTMEGVRALTGVLLLIVGVGLASGLL